MFIQVPVGSTSFLSNYTSVRFVHLRVFKNFTTTDLIDQVLMQIKDEEALTFPDKLKGDPNKRSKDKYYRFHHDYGHDTADCYDLK